MVRKRLEDDPHSETLYQLVRVKIKPAIKDKKKHSEELMAWMRHNDHFGVRKLSWCSRPGMLQIMVYQSGSQSTRWDGAAGMCQTLRVLKVREWRHDSR